MDKTTVLATGFLVVATICLLGSLFVANFFVCDAKTANIGFAHYYGVFSGCMIEVTPGQWIPLENYYFKQE